MKLTDRGNGYCPDLPISDSEYDMKFVIDIELATLWLNILDVLQIYSFVVRKFRIVQVLFTTFLKLWKNTFPLLPTSQYQKYN